MKKIKNNNYLNKIKDNFIKNSSIIFVFKRIFINNLINLI